MCGTGDAVGRQQRHSPLGEAEFVTLSPNGQKVTTRSVKPLKIDYLQYGVEEM